MHSVTLEPDNRDMIAQALASDRWVVACLVRGEQVIMAHHDTVLQADDHVILFITDRRHVEQVERLFLGETLGRR